jgi:hypothetical protein
MATLIVSWGGNTDTGYATLAEADDYIGSATTPGYKADTTVWSNLLPNQRTSLLLGATRDIDNADTYIGQRQFVDQTLEFPRVPSGEAYWPWVQSSLTSANTFNIYLAEQKRRVKQATIEHAFSLARDGERDEHIERQLKGIRSFSESVGPLSESASYGGAVMPLAPEAMELLAPYRSGSVELVRG